MKKNITKEQIVTTALELMSDSIKTNSLNFREVARTMGCAHTNLYNYFPTYNDLLWAAHTAVQNIFVDTLIDKLNHVNDVESELKTVFGILVDFYLGHTGWFRLAWQECIGGERPQTDIEAT